MTRKQDSAKKVSYQKDVQELRGPPPAVYQHECSHRQVPSGNFDPANASIVTKLLK